MSSVFIEKHFSLSVSRFEGVWEMTFRSPHNSIENVNVYVIASNSDFRADDYSDRPIVKAGARLSEVMERLIYKIDRYPFTWHFSGKKIVPFGYDFECDYRNNNITWIDLTEIAHREVNEFYNFFSPLDARIVQEGEIVSASGVMTKLKITLDKPKHVNQLSIDYFSEFPVELVSLMYRVEDEETAPLFELPLLDAVTTASSLNIHFLNVYARVFYLIIRQESYTLTNSVMNIEKLEQGELWAIASEMSRVVYDNAVEVYLEDTFTTRSGVQLHQEILDTHKTINRDTEGQFVEGFNPSRADFNNAKARLDSNQR